MRNWKFPESFDGRETTVGYSFILSPGEQGKNTEYFATGIGKDFEERWENAPTYPSSKDVCNERSNKVASLAETLGIPRLAASAWWVVRRRLHVGSPMRAFMLAADILRQDGNLEDAQRILSEAIRLYPDAVANEFCRWGNVVDMDRIAQISVRKTMLQPRCFGL